jgi:hypothetical protein
MSAAERPWPLTRGNLESEELYDPAKIAFDNHLVIASEANLSRICRRAGRPVVQAPHRHCHI